VGTLYRQVSAFEARKVGAALTARNIAAHIERELLDRPQGWRPLVYCWRGGKRSASMAHVLREVGWPAATLEGGYRAYRRAVLDDLAHLPSRFRWRVLCGRTGSGKSRLLRTLAAFGAQVLDLEALACHRGSVLGHLPDAPQPSQKWFESLVRQALAGLDPAQAVYVESESRRIGGISVPEALIESIRGGECFQVEATLAQRVALLKKEYAHLVANPEVLAGKLARLTSLHGRERIAAWQGLAREGRMDELVGALLELHYDPTYGRSIRKNFSRHDAARLVPLAGIADGDFANLARRLAGAD
jgi:tRNA 2-selenouridine synthase